MKDNFWEVFVHTWHWIYYKNLEIKKIDSLHISASPRGVKTKALDCDLEESEVELRSRRNIHLRANTHRKGMNNLIPHGMS